MFKIFQKRLLAVVFLSFVLVLLISACETDAEAGKRLPTIAPTETALPHVTPTPFPAFGKAIPTIDWNEVDHMVGAMRSQYAGDIEAWVDTRRYYLDVTLELNEVAAIISGTQLARYTNNSETTLNEVFFRLYPNMPDKAARMTIGRTVVNGQEVTPEFVSRNTALRVSLPNPLAPGQSAEILIDFTTLTEHGNTLSTRVSYQLDQFSMGGWHPVFAPYETNNNEWWIGFYEPVIDPNYTETALYEIKLTRQENMVVIISGVTIETQSNGDGTVTDHIVTGPMRYSFLIASPVMGKISETTGDGVLVNVYFMPGGERAANWVMETTVKSVELFNRLYGDYPFAELDVAETFNRAGGIEYPGLFIVNTDFWTINSATTENIVAHETAHQWWFSVVGNDQLNYVWIDEALAFYSADYVYLRETYTDGEYRAEQNLINRRNTYNFLRSSGAVDHPLNAEAYALLPNEIFYIYGTKGPLFYTELENLLGRETFYRALNIYYNEMKYQVATAGDILRAFETASGMELDELFYEWIGDFEGVDPAAKEAVDRRRAAEENSVTQ